MKSIKINPMYLGRCKQCIFRVLLTNEEQVQQKSEDHMMETGHTVQILEIV